MCASLGEGNRRAVIELPVGHHKVSLGRSSRNDGHPGRRVGRVKRTQEAAVVRILEQHRVIGGVLPLHPLPKCRHVAHRGDNLAADAARHIGVEVVGAGPAKLSSVLPAEPGGHGVSAAGIHIEGLHRIEAVTDGLLRDAHVERLVEFENGLLRIVLRRHESEVAVDGEEAVRGRVGDVLIAVVVVVDLVEKDGVEDLILQPVRCASEHEGKTLLRLE